MQTPPVPAGFPDRIGPIFRERFEFHLATPFVSSDQYRLHRDCQRGQRALSSTRIYVDTNHWIGLRDVHRGISAKASYVRLLEVLQQLTKARRAVVVLSDQLITELCHQADSESREATAEVIDELSDGVTIVGFDRRVVLETLQWAHASLHNSNPLPLLTVWTTLPNAIQSREYHLVGVPPALSIAFTKTIEDVNETLRLGDLLPSPDRLFFPMSDSQMFALSLTANKEKGQLGSLRFEDFFHEEADRYLSTIVPKMPPEVTSELHKLVDAYDSRDDDLVSGVKRVFWAQNRAGSHPQALPGLRIVAGCAGRISTEPGRRFKRGDQGDIFHGAAALPYCNVFLTDAPMRHLITSSPTDLASRYQCSVIDDPIKAADHLQRLVA